MQAQTKYKKKPFKRDSLHDIANDIAKIIRQAIKEDKFLRITIILREDNEIIKEITELKSKSKIIGDKCLRMYDDIESGVIEMTLELVDLEKCDSKTLADEIRRLREYYRKLLKDELWIKELKEGGDGQ